MRTPEKAFLRRWYLGKGLKEMRKRAMWISGENVLGRETSKGLSKENSKEISMERYEQGGVRKAMSDQGQVEPCMP